MTSPSDVIQIESTTLGGAGMLQSVGIIDFVGKAVGDNDFSILGETEG